jgi:peptidoglycan/LPS O-acetylase OafA/YrhL
MERVAATDTEAIPRAKPAIPQVPPTGERAVAAGTSKVRPEIQALRAIAVLLVVAYHLWPAAVPGGFVGVDVFFAISGFLITSLLLREIERTGTISLSAFWARRARRILPAALAMLMLCGVATVALVPQTYWPQFLGDIRASTVYVQNWRLASAAVDYMRAADAPSPVQHYWSLSAEEQFYLVWPVLLIGAAAVARRRPVAVRRGAIAAAMLTLSAGSLAYSLYDTAADTAAAYFVTPTRAWEFGAGGLLALAGDPAAGRTASRAVLQWAGLAAIAVAAVTYSDATPFPSYAAALPVLGAVAVMRAGAPARRWAPTRALGLSPMQFLGDISYAVYLWHWPLLVLAPFAIGAVTTSTGIVIVMLTILAAWLTKLVVEDPVRSGSFLTRRRPAWTFALAALATAVVLSVPAGGTAYVQAQLHRAERASSRILASHPTCFGAAARDPLHPCDNPRLRFTVVPSPLQARSMGNAPCTVVQRRGRVRVCAFGTSPRRAVATIALIGDSHASHWRAALEVLARAKRWRGLSMTHTSCPFSTATAQIVEPDRTRCVQWNRQLRQWFTKHPEVTTVFVAAHSGGRVVTTRGRSNFAMQVAGYTGAWKALARSVTRIVVMRDTPKMRGSTLGCVQRAMSNHRRPGPACAVPRGGALQRDPEVTAARRMGRSRVGVVDVTPQLCSRRQCFPVIGGALVFHDIHHFTPVFARTLAPFVRRQIEAIPAPAG